MLCCTACEDGQTIASGSSNGSVHVWRVEYVTRSGGLPDKYTGFQGAQRRQQAVLCTTAFQDILCVRCSLTWSILP